MIGTDINVNASTALLAVVIGVLFLWAASYAIASSLALVGVIGVLAVIAFVVLWTCSRRVFTRLAHGRRRTR